MVPKPETKFTDMAYINDCYSLAPAFKPVAPEEPSEAEASSSDTESELHTEDEETTDSSVDVD